MARDRGMAYKHFEQPHSTCLSSSSVKEEPSRHWKKYFLLLLRRGTQHCPPPQLPRHSRRGTLEALAHEVWPCCLRTTSRMMSPWQRLSAGATEMERSKKCGNCFAGYSLHISEQTWVHSVIQDKQMAREEP